MNLNPEIFYKNQHVSIKQTLNIWKVISLQNGSTPGIYKKYMLK